MLYPEWAKLVGFADAAVPMMHDHEAIVERIERLEQANNDDVDALQELLYGLYALISVHFRKEEDIQLPPSTRRRSSQRLCSSAWRHSDRARPRTRPLAGLPCGTGRGGPRTREAQSPERPRARVRSSPSARIGTDADAPPAAAA